MGDKVKVYFFKVWNGTTDSYEMPPRKSTADRIKNICKGEILLETEEEVDSDLLDDEGRYDPSQGDIADDQLDRVAEKPPSNPGTLASASKKLPN